MYLVYRCVLDVRVGSGLLVVSSTEAVPVEQFLKLSQEQHRIQHSGEYTNPKWFIPNTLKYYVLLHDMSEGDEQRYGRTAVQMSDINLKPIRTEPPRGRGEATFHFLSK